MAISFSESNPLSACLIPVATNSAKLAFSSTLNTALRGDDFSKVVRTSVRFSSVELSTMRVRSMPKLCLYRAAIVL